MREGIHPEYKESTITCACGNVFTTKSTKENIKGGIVYDSALYQPLEQYQPVSPESENYPPIYG